MTLMQLNFNGITFLCGDAERLLRQRAFRPLTPFAPQTVQLLNDFSKALFADPRAKSLSDVISLAFWCRPASLEKMRQQFMPAGHVQGRGVVFHIAPANVAVNFAYSLIAGLLMGNANVVRLSSRYFEQTPIICDAFTTALAKNPAMADSVALIQYGHDATLTDYFSANCDVRVIWGGDNTIATIRKSALPPRGLDISFADRYSFSVLNAEAWLGAENKQNVLEAFYNDTLLTDQQACTAAKLVVWTGEGVERARASFWAAFRDWLAGRFTQQPAMAVKNLAFFCEQATLNPSLIRLPQPDNTLFLAQTNVLNPLMLEQHHNAGFFFEYVANEFNEIAPLCTDKCQTISTFGIAQQTVSDFFSEIQPRGVDRVIPLGQSMAFSLHWDGYQLPELLTRRSTVMPG